jgi:hypothetical protein
MTYLTIEICGEEDGKLTVTTRQSERHWDMPCLCEPITAREIVDYWTAELPPFEKQANVDYIDSVWDMMTPDGIWGYPNIQEAFKKVEDHKWLLQDYEDVHNDVTSRTRVQGIRLIGQDGDVKYLRAFV